MDQQMSGGARPDLSIAISCFNEEECLPFTVPALASALAEAGIDYELVLVDNGSVDRTGQIIDELAASGLPVVKGAVPENRGLGLGFRAGFSIARGRFVATQCADGQVAPADVIRVYAALRQHPGSAIAKVRRRFRQDSWLRKIVSVTYNVMMHLLFPGIKALDVNGNPKAMSRETLQLLDLSSDDWFLDAEILLKARHLRLPVIELDVPGFAREAGGSSVVPATVLEFLGNIASYRLGGPWRDWKRRTRPLRPLTDGGP